MSDMFVTEPTNRTDVASITVTADGTVLKATDAALALLGLTFGELKALPRGALSAEPADPEADVAFMAQWEEQGRPDIGGAATLKLLDGKRIRVRFALRPLDDGGFLVLLDRTTGRVEQPASVFTGGKLMSEWRAAERRLAEVEPGGPEAEWIESEIERLRTLYQSLFS
jgi:hypothetical protein